MAPSLFFADKIHSRSSCVEDCLCEGWGNLKIATTEHREKYLARDAIRSGKGGGNAHQLRKALDVARLWWERKGLLRYHLWSHISKNNLQYHHRNS